ncbi:MAG: phage tail protein [Geobacter sp.]|nr:phage tail protein [Geobacter sp.]
MALGSRRDPYLSFNFLVELEGLLVGGFSEVSGLQAEIELHDYREGGLNDYVHRLAGPVRYPANLVLKRGITDNQALWLWHCDVRRGIIARRNLTVILQDQTGQPVNYWHLERAYPVRWMGPELRADSNTVAVETLELVHCGFSTL